MGKMTRYDILLFKGTDWVSRIIQYATGSVYSHVGFVYDENFLIEARSWYGVQSRDIKSIAVGFVIKNDPDNEGIRITNLLLE